VGCETTAGTSFTATSGSLSNLQGYSDLADYSIANVPTFAEEFSNLLNVSLLDNLLSEIYGSTNSWFQISLLSKASSVEKSRELSMPELFPEGKMCYWVAF